MDHDTIFRPSSPAAGARPALPATGPFASPAVRPPLPPERPGGRALALIAHDGKKSALLGLARTHMGTLLRRRLLVTATTGRLLAADLGLHVEALASGPEGGDLQIGARIVAGTVDAVIFLRDPLTAHPHEPDIQALLKVCDVHCVPVATNVASADILLRFEAERDWWAADGASAGVGTPDGPEADGLDDFGHGLADAPGYGAIPYADDDSIA